MKKIILLILILFTVSACQSRMDVTDELKKTDGKIYHLTAPYKNTEITITFSETDSADLLELIIILVI